MSTDKQAERELSLPAQQQAMREYAARQQWTIVQEFVEAGASGRTTERPVLRELLSRLKQMPLVDVVLVHKIDRLARNVYDHATIKAVLKQKGVRLASVVENVDDSITGQLVENIMASIAQFYSANLGEETKKGMRMMVEKGGWPHRPPKGYTLTRDANGRSCIVPDPIHAATVQRAFELYVTGGYSLGDLSTMLAAEGLLTNRGKPLPAGYLRDMLQNPFYCGQIPWKGRVYPGQHTPLVDALRFERAAAVLRSRYKDPGKKGKYHFFLRGVAVCGTCGARVTAEKHDRWSYYRCLAHTRRQCSARFSNADRAHESVQGLYRRLSISARLHDLLRSCGEELLESRLASQRQRQASLRAEKVHLEARRVHVAEAFADGRMVAQVYGALAEKIESKLQATVRSLAEATADASHAVRRLSEFFDSASTLWDLHQRFDVLGQHRLARLVFHEVVLDEGVVTSYRMRPPFDALLVDAQRPRDNSDDSAPPSGETPDALRHLVITALTPAIEFIFELSAEPAA